jgi:hypothetical protein
MKNEKLSIHYVHQQFDEISFKYYCGDDKKSYYLSNENLLKFNELAAKYNLETGVVEMFGHSMDTDTIISTDSSPKEALIKLERILNKVKSTDYVSEVVRQYINRTNPTKIEIIY